MIVSSLTTILCIGVAVGLIWRRHPMLPWIAFPPLAIVFGGALFTIRGYTITPEAILVHGLFWTTRLPLANLQSAQFKPHAMRWNIRTFGNGGLFSFSGRFRNRALGAYRALVTDPHRTVVLRFRTRTVVVSPSAPDEFIHDLGVNK